MYLNLKEKKYLSFKIQKLPYKICNNPLYGPPFHHTDSPQIYSLHRPDVSYTQKHSCNLQPSTHLRFLDGSHHHPPTATVQPITKTVVNRSAGSRRSERDAAFRAQTHARSLLTSSAPLTVGFPFIWCAVEVNDSVVVRHGVEGDGSLLCRGLVALHAENATIKGDFGVRECA